MGDVVFMQLVNRLAELDHYVFDDTKVVFVVNAIKVLEKLGHIVCDVLLDDDQLVALVGDEEELLYKL